MRLRVLSAFAPPLKLRRKRSGYIKLLLKLFFPRSFNNLRGMKLRLRPACILLTLLLIASGSVFAQKRISAKKLAKHQAKKLESKRKKTVIASLDTIFNVGQAYAILKKKKQLPYHYFTVSSLDNKLLIEITTHTGNDLQQTLYYQFFFTDTERNAEIEKYSGQKLEKIIVENRLISSNQMDGFSEMEFVMTYPPCFSNPAVKRYIHDNSVAGNSQSSFKPVERDHLAPFYLRDGKILQDYQHIGSYKFLDSLTRIYLPNNFMVAEARDVEADPSRRSILTLKDRRSTNIRVEKRKELEDVIAYLCENGYL